MDDCNEPINYLHQEIFIKDEPFQFDEKTDSDVSTILISEERIGITENADSFNLDINNSDEIFRSKKGKYIKRAYFVPKQGFGT